jgi:hypothetical protein
LDDIPPEVAAALTPEEKDEVATTIDFYHRSAGVGRRAKFLSFPEQLRVTLEYLQTKATSEEKQIIVGAIMEGLRQIRRRATSEFEDDGEGGPR